MDLTYLYIQQITSLTIYLIFEVYENNEGEIFYKILFNFEVVRFSEFPDNLKKLDNGSI